MRETIEDFRAIDTEPFGINGGDAASHQQFIDQLGLPFDLLIDEGLAVTHLYEATKGDSDSIQRTVVIVGKSGKIIFRAQGAPSPGELLAAIEKAAD